MIAEQQAKRWSQIVARTWEDVEFKQRLLTEPVEVLKESGLGVPTGMEVRVVENSDRVLYLTLPIKPQPRELSDEELEQVSGGLVTIEYLVLGTFLALSLIVGVTSNQAPTGTKPAPTRR